MNLRDKIIWFYGLSGSGKSTLADALQKYLWNNGLEPLIDEIQRLDGDVIRGDLTKDLGFSLDDRFTHIRRVSVIADLLSRHGITVIASFITPLKAMRLFLRQKFGDRLILIYVDCPVEVCIERDVKGLYKKALNGEIKEFTGLTQQFDYPHVSYQEDYDIGVPSGYWNVDESLEYIVRKLDDITSRKK